ncbi:uncharacterized protein BO96DRAFT_327314 [Aspergillus niger CBS 101883]|uniref:uncharacterized protein n=1 Tax=Aspergillus lacticoffeatus (strain CBS 101883) TaxID=1450533 RepID=UPI000D7F00D7|nr:uncharacterized protein BO96DRAFT_327314 [Aspergillus niger CBS 101883]PYH60633.1 hypothetical protein BO96DRAFT_327314 [Aspergillus niger CBS 101883]
MSGRFANHPIHMGEGERARLIIIVPSSHHIVELQHSVVWYKLLSYLSLFLSVGPSGLSVGKVNLFGWFFSPSWFTSAMGWVGRLNGLLGLEGKRMTEGKRLMRERIESGSNRILPNAHEGPNGHSRSTLTTGSCDMDGLTIIARRLS